MESIVPKTEKETRPAAARRRRKKRRTEDFSDSSDSSSSDSSSASEAEQEEQEPEQNGVETVDGDGDVVLDDNEIQLAGNENFDDVKAKLKTVNLTKTALNERTKNINTAQVESTLTRNQKQLENDYLELMFETYGDDINKLREAPDFSERSLGVLANALKNGSNIFDEATLRAVVKK